MSVPAVANVSIDHVQASLAAELAARLLPLPEILKRHNLTKAQLRALMRDPQFKHMVAEFRREWNSPLSAKQRIQQKAALAVEDNLLELHRMFNDIELNPNARLEAFKQLVQLSDTAPKAHSSAEGVKFSLRIDLSAAGEDKTVTIDATPQENDDGDDSD